MQGIFLSVSIPPFLPPSLPLFLLFCIYLHKWELEQSKGKKVAGEGIGQRKDTGQVSEVEGEIKGGGRERGKGKGTWNEFNNNIMLYTCMNVPQRIQSVCTCRK